VTVLQGIRRALGPTASVVYERGCELAEGLPPTLFPVPPENLRGADGAAGGLTGSYYPNMNLEGAPRFVRLDKGVDLDGAEEPRPTASRLTGFSVRWEGALIADTGGTYTLGVVADDGFRLFVDDSLFLEDWRDGTPRRNGREITLHAGQKHRIRLEYYENAGTPA